MDALLVVLTGDVAATERLEDGDHFGQLDVALLRDGRARRCGRRSSTDQYGTSSGPSPNM